VSSERDVQERNTIGENWVFPFSRRKKMEIFPSHRLCLNLLFYLLAPVPLNANPELGMGNLTEEDHHSATFLFIK